MPGRFYFVAMRQTLEQIVKVGAAKKKRWVRQPNGRYTIFALPLSEPHNYDGDVFDQDRQKSILENTLRDEPEGGVWVGHPGLGDTEAPITGTLTGYRESALGIGRHVADWADLEPTTFLDIYLERWRTYSIEYRLPNLDAYKGVALLGRSQAFFNFARVSVKLTPAELKTLRRDADAWPTTTAARSVNTDPTDPKGTRDMKKTFRQTMTKKDGLRWEVQEIDENGKAGKWRALREGESVEKDDDSTIRAAIEEIGERIGNLESRMEQMEDGKGGDDRGEPDDDPDDEPDDEPDDDKDKGRGKDDKDDKDRSKPKTGNRKARPAKGKAFRALEKRLDDAEVKNVRTAYDAKIDTLVAAGTVIDKAGRKVILDAVMATKDDGRADVFEALTKNVRTAPLTDQDDGGIVDADDAALADYDEGEVKGVRSFLKKLGPNGRKAARAELKLFNNLREKDPSAHGIHAGPLNWLKANIVPGEHDE